MNIIGNVEIAGKTYALVESGTGGYVNGIFTRYLVVPIANLEKKVEDIRAPE